MERKLIHMIAHHQDKDNIIYQVYVGNAIAWEGTDQDECNRYIHWLNGGEGKPWVDEID